MSGRPLSTLALASLASAGLLPRPAIAAEAVTLKPSTPWNLDYSDDSCALRRNFGVGAETVALELRQFAPGDGFSVIVASKSFGFRERPPKVRFLPDAKPRVAEDPLYLNYPNGASGVQWSDSLFYEVDLEEAKKRKKDEDAGGPSRSDAEYKQRESEIRGLEVGGSFARPVVLSTGEMHRTMAGMRKCLDELVTHWGIDAAAQRTLTRRVSPSGQMSWVRKIQEHYPESMLRQEKSGVVVVRMTVGPEGEPTACKVQIKSQDPSFETTACREMMKAARFKPALDAAGKPIASYFITRVIYMVN